MDRDLRALAEGIVHDYDPRDRPDGLEIVDRADLVMWTRPGPTKWMSSVRVTRWDPTEADAQIQEVLVFFRERVRPFVWFVTPSSAPSDLADRLTQAGLQLEQRTRLLVAELPVAGLRRNEDVTIVDCRTAEETEARLRFAWPDWSDEVIRAETADRLRSLALYGDRFGGLLAYQGDTPVADANWRDSTDGRAIYLTGGGTRPEHRGKGIYQTLTAQRLTSAARRGCRYAVIQARVDTSMPILLRRGFQDVGEVSVFEWSPARA